MRKKKLQKLSSANTENLGQGSQVGTAPIS